MMEHAIDHAKCHADEGGPTTCMATPAVLRSIRRELKSENILSIADAKLAMRSGMIAMPAVMRSGFNDGVIYQPDAGQSSDSAGPIASSARPTKRYAMAAPKGKLHCLVLLVDFEDNVGTREPADFDRLLFDQENPDSMTSFYKEMSFGALTISGETTKWIRAKHTYDYYTNGASGMGQYPNNAPGLLEELLATFCSTDDLSRFDCNGDGYIDGLFLVHAGGGAEAEPDPDRRRDMIWSHKWTLPTRIEYNGVSAYAYFTAPEDGKLGVFAHEFGHFLGLPDLYDTSYRSHGIGRWCLMSGGSWNGGGDQPARLSAWCLKTLGWITPTTVKVRGTLNIPPLEDDKTACYKLWTGGKPNSEYFLIENRQRDGRDAALPGSGLLLWHIDESQSENNNPIAFRVALVQADGLRDLETLKNDGDSGDPFPGSGDVKRVDGKYPHPNTRDNIGNDTGITLSRITESGTNIRLAVKV